MSTGIKLSEAQFSKIIQSERFLGNMIGKLDKNVRTNVAFLFTRNNLSGLVSNGSKCALKRKK